MQATFDALLANADSTTDTATNDNVTPSATDTEAVIAQLKNLSGQLTALTAKVDELAKAATPSEVSNPTNKDLMQEFDESNGKIPENENESEDKTE